MSQPIGKRFLISGRVQGVFYRRFAHNAAKQFHLTGWARNLADGRVEVSVFGEAAQIEKYVTLLWQGPPAANVTDIVAETLAWEDHTDFSVKE